MHVESYRCFDPQTSSCRISSSFFLIATLFQSSDPTLKDSKTIITTMQIESWSVE